MKVFISHSDVDAQLAARVSTALKSRGLDVWDPEIELLPGDNWAAGVARALEESEAMVVLFTPNAVRSWHVKREMEFALVTRSYRNRLIPVAIGDRSGLPEHEVPWIVRRLPWFELNEDGGGNAEVERIAQAIRIPA